MLTREVCITASLHIIMLVEIRGTSKLTMAKYLKHTYKLYIFIHVKMPSLTSPFLFHRLCSLLMHYYQIMYVYEYRARDLGNP